jgi:hypothetical protein
LTRPPPVLCALPRRTSRDMKPAGCSPPASSVTTDLATVSPRRVMRPGVYQFVIQGPGRLAESNIYSVPLMDTACRGMTKPRSNPRGFVGSQCGSMHRQCVSILGGVVREPLWYREFRRASRRTNDSLSGQVLVSLVAAGAGVWCPSGCPITGSHGGRRPYQQ